jgi:hypothetical protein
MISDQNPETMTTEERRLEVASILAGGLLRRVAQRRTARLDAPKPHSANPQNALDLPSETRLSVAQRPTGSASSLERRMPKGGTLMQDFANQIAALDRMSIGDLAERYRELHGQPAFS